ncbi:unnamed protein product [Triticum turgidum subsp. durum]|uniref:Aquaporin n=1 Tax=Triticum turgidum subsp. durum TaxID=4567 RepID=A0A9R1P2K8_TRITD|nr:unnamed protein product [Triticum turgidum subsp. durum]
MEGKEEDVRLGANKYSERQPIGTAAQGSEDKDYKEPPPAPLFEPGELKSWSFYRAGIAEFMATFLFLYVTILTVMGYILAPLPIGFAVFLVHLATIPITGTGINPARSLGAAIIYNREHAWSDHWIFWVGPFIGAALAAVYHQVVIRAIPFKTKS